MVMFWLVECRDYGLKFDGDRQQTKIYIFELWKFVSPKILKVEFQEEF